MPIDFRKHGRGKDRSDKDETRSFLRMFSWKTGEVKWEKEVDNGSVISDLNSETIAIKVGRKVKKFESGVVKDPITVSPDTTIHDLLNMIKIQQKLNLVKLNQNAYKFYSKWEDNLEYINVSMRAIRKIQ